MLDWFFKSETYTQMLKPLWDSGQYFLAIKKAFDRMPDMSYPGIYDPSQDHNWKHPVFWWRELWHMIGGILFALPFFIWCPWYIPTAGVCAFAFYKEFSEDVKDQGGKPDFKNYVDGVVWTLGAFLISFLGSLV